MKKTLFFILGALCIAMLPTTNAQAQSASHNVTWKNYDYLGHDTTIVYSEADGKIRPVLTTPYTDTLLIAWYIDSTLTTPWSFLEEVLTSDTTLWPRWVTVSASEQVYHVSYNMQGFNSNPTYPYHYDTVEFVGVPGTRHVLYPVHYKGFTPAVDSIVIAALPATDTLVKYNYTRNTYKLFFNLKGGSFSDGALTTQDVYYGASINYNHPVTRSNCQFRAWTPVSAISPLAKMPAHNYTVTAYYDYILTWVGTGTTTTYCGGPISNVFAYYVDDLGNNRPANLRYEKDGASSSTAVTVGTYTVNASSPDPYNYPLYPDTVRSVTIVPFPLTVSGIQIDTVKYYDENSLAYVVNPGTINSFGSDAVTHTTVARYNDAEPGKNKSIIGYFTLSGADAANYSIEDLLICTKAAIIDFAVDTIEIDPAGYCDDTIKLRTQLHYTGLNQLPDQYCILFDNDPTAIAQGFPDSVTWTNTGVSTVFNIEIPVPANAQSGYYTGKLTFRDTEFPNFECKKDFTFHVNLGDDFVYAIFNDVLSIVDTCNCFSNYQWYHNGVAIDGATEAWYQDPNGLSGTYHVAADRDGVRTWTCEKEYQFQSSAKEMTIEAYPNPTIDRVNIMLKDSPNYSHTMRVMNVMGLTVLNTTFDGNETTINLQGLNHGTYTVSIDGQTVRVIKK